MSGASPAVQLLAEKLVAKGKAQADDPSLQELLQEDEERSQESRIQSTLSLHRMQLNNIQRQLNTIEGKIDQLLRKK